MSKLNFCLPFYIGAESHLIKRLHNVQIKAARAAIGSFCFKKSNEYILKKCKLLKIDKTIQISLFKFIHNIIISKKPKTIYSIYKIPRRTVAQITTHYSPKKARLSN